MILVNKHLIIVGIAVLLIAIGLSGCINYESNTNPIELGDITPKEAFDLIQNNSENKNFSIIDVRTPEEYANGYIENSTNIIYNSNSFIDEVNQLDKNKTYLVYCRLGRRSRKAVNIMKELGIKEVYNMVGGITRWEAEGLPIVEEDRSGTPGFEFVFFIIALISIVLYKRKKT